LFLAKNLVIFMSTSGFVFITRNILDLFADLLQEGDRQNSSVDDAIGYSSCHAVSTEPRPLVSLTAAAQFIQFQVTRQGYQHLR
jgi:hypothetical protein